MRDKKKSFESRELWKGGIPLPSVGGSSESSELQAAEGEPPAGEGTAYQTVDGGFQKPQGSLITTVRFNNLFF